LLGKRPGTLSRRIAFSDAVAAIAVSSQIRSSPPIRTDDGLIEEDRSDSSLAAQRAKPSRQKFAFGRSLVGELHFDVGLGP
jgi:hypothetical protein